MYRNGVNIENFKFIYSVSLYYNFNILSICIFFIYNIFIFNFQKLYCTIFNPIYFGFSSIEQLLKVLDQIIEVRNNVLYPKNEFKLCENMDFKNKNVNTQV